MAHPTELPSDMKRTNPELFPDTERLGVKVSNDVTGAVIMSKDVTFKIYGKVAVDLEKWR